MRTEIINILAESGVKISKEKQAQIVESLYSIFQANSSKQSHPSFEQDGVTMIWCSRHGEYHPIEYMVPNKSKKEGVANYCKAAQRKWEWMHAKSGLLASYAANEFMNDNQVKAKKLMELSQYMKETKNVVSTFDHINIDMNSDLVVKLCEDEFFADFPELKSKPKLK